MTESEWLSCGEPDRMIDSLGTNPDERKLRQFACACVRRIWDLVVDDHSRQAVLTAEEFARGSASESELQTAAARALDAAGFDGDGGAEVVAAAAAASPDLNVVAAAHHAAWARAEAMADAAISAGTIKSSNYERFGETAFREERAAQATLLRRIFGNPFDAKSGAQP